MPVKIEFDIETNPLEIKTDSAVGSGDRVEVYFRTSKGDFGGGIRISFEYNVRYALLWCTPSNYFPTKLPTARNKVWRITKTKTSEDIKFQIHCNGVEVLNVLLSRGLCTDDGRWSIYYPRYINRLHFTYRDTASDYYYRPYQKPG